MKNIKRRKLNKNTNDNLFFIKKVFLFTFFFLGILIITNYNLNLSNIKQFLWDISKYWKWLLWPQDIIQDLSQIHNESLIWPFDEVTNWWIIDDYWYDKAKFTPWDKLPEKYKIAFPQKISDIIEKYKYIPPSNVWAYISNPQERKTVIFFKRLLTTSWTASYTCNSKICLWWIPNSWTHKWQDIVTSINTPIKSIANWIIIQKKSNPKGFWNYLIIASEIDWQIIATFYGHLNKFADWIEEWTIVKQWQIIWYVWNTWISTAPHLHLQINKIWKPEEIKWKTFSRFINKIFPKWKSKDLNRIKENTYNPVTFIEKHLWSFSSSEKKSFSVGILETSQTKNNQQKQYSIIPLQIIQIINPKISWKLTVWDQFEIKIITTGAKWNITLTDENWILKLDKYSILPTNWQNEYKIKITALKPWNDRLFISDWINTESLPFTVYPKQKTINFIKIIWPKTFYKTYPTQYQIVAVDNLGNLATIKLDWKIMILLIDKNTNKAIYKKEFLTKSKTPITYFSLQAPQIWKEYTLKVKYWNKKWKLWIAKKTIKSDLFIDYSIKDQYWTEIVDLVNKNIIHWSSWLLLPNNPLKKHELVTILLRYKYWDKYDEWKKQYLEYIKKNWNIFKDLDPKNRWAPYIYKAWKDWLLKWDKWYSYHNKDTNLVELIMIYWRFFQIKSDDPFVIWKNLRKDKEIVPYAKAAKKFNLYPFENLTNFKRNKTITRLNAFVSLYRYINFKPKNKLSLSINNLTTHTAPEKENSDEKLKNMIKMLLK